MMYLAGALVAVALLAWDAFRRWLISRDAALSGAASDEVGRLKERLDEQHRRLDEQHKRINALSSTQSRSQVFGQLSPLAKRRGAQ